MLSEIEVYTMPYDGLIELIFRAWDSTTESYIDRSTMYSVMPTQEQQDAWRQESIEYFNHVTGNTHGNKGYIVRRYNRKGEEISTETTDNYARAVLDRQLDLWQNKAHRITIHCTCGIKLCPSV